MADTVVLGSVKKGKLDLDNFAKAYGYNSESERKNYKKENPELYDAMGGVKYQPTGAPLRNRENVISSQKAVNNIVNRMKTVDFQKVQDSINVIALGEWQDANTMKMHTDTINSYVNDFVVLENLGYFNSISKSEREEMTSSFKAIKEYANLAKDVFSAYENKEGYLNKVWEDKYSNLTWEELDDAIETVKFNNDEYCEKEIEYINSLRDGFTNAITYNNYIDIKSKSFDELSEEYFKTRRVVKKYTDIQNSRQATYDQLYDEYEAKLKLQGFTDDEIQQMLQDDSSGYLKMLRDHEDNLKIDERYGSVDGLMSNYYLLDELYHRGYSNQQTADMVLAAQEDTQYLYYVEKGKNKLKRNKYMTDSEYEVACYYKGKGGNDSEKYSEAIEDELQRREINDRRQKFAKFADNMPVLANNLSVAFKIIAAGEQIVDAAKFMATGDMDYNTNALAASTIRNTTANKIENPMGKRAYNAVMSVADNFAAQGVSKLLTGSRQFGSIILGLSAAGEATNNAIMSGKSDGYAFASGIAAGVIETVFENWSIGKFAEGVNALDIKDLRSLSSFIGKNVWNNVVEEDLTEIANITYDILVNGSYEKSIRNYMISGLSEKAAKKKVAQDLAKQVGETTVNSALMGFAFSAAGASKKAVVNSINTNIENTISRLQTHVNSNIDTIKTEPNKIDALIPNDNGIKLDEDKVIAGMWEDAENTTKSTLNTDVEKSQLKSVEKLDKSGIIEKTVKNDTGILGEYTDEIVWSIYKHILVRKFGKGYFGKRIKQHNSRVDNYELKINPNNESYYLQHPDGKYVQFENMVDNVLQDGKCILNKKRSFYHVYDYGYIARKRVLEQANRQVEVANSVGYKVEWLVSDEKAVEQISRLFKENNINISVKFYQE